MPKTAAARLEAAQRAAEQAQPARVFAVVYEAEGRVYDAWPWGDNARELSPAEVAALEERFDLTRIEYVKDWKGAAAMQQEPERSETETAEAAAIGGISPEIVRAAFVSLCDLDPETGEPLGAEDLTEGGSHG